MGIKSFTESLAKSTTPAGLLSQSSVPSSFGDIFTATPLQKLSPFGLATQFGDKLLPGVPGLPDLPDFFGAFNQPLPALPSLGRTDVVRPDIAQRPGDFRAQVQQGIQGQVGKVGETLRGLGISAPGLTSQFRERGIKVGERVVAKKELKSALEAQDKAITDFIDRAGITDRISVQQARATLDKRFNETRLKLLKVAREFQKKLKARDISNKERKALAAQFGQLAKSMGWAMAGGIG